MGRQLSWEDVVRVRSDELGRRGVEGGDKAIGCRMRRYKLPWRDWWVCLMAGVKKMLGFGGGDGGSGGSGVKLHLVEETTCE